MCIRDSSRTIFKTCWQNLVSNLRIGQGFDAHKIIKGSKDFILGGISIDSEYEVVAHSDGDIISHAIIDALLGACKMGDIGKLAPSNEENKGISSIYLLKKVATMLLEAGYQIVNIDLTYVGSNISKINICLLYTSPSPRDRTRSRMPSSA